MALPWARWGLARWAMVSALTLAPVAGQAKPLGALASPPATGRQAAELCVATLPRPLSCGLAQADLRRDGTLSVRVDDITYNLRLFGSRVEVVVMHNVVQIDEFTAPCEWVGRTLRFHDDDRHSRYEIRFTQPPSATR